MSNQIKLLVFVLVMVLIAYPALAQKGSGNDDGVAQSGQYEIVFLSGVITDIHIGPCEDATAGDDPIGVHLFIEVENGTEINLHLGPEIYLEQIIEQLAVGDFILFEALQTEDLSENAHIAKRLILDDRIIELRDENLKPFWAG